MKRNRNTHEITRAPTHQTIVQARPRSLLWDRIAAAGAITCATWVLTTLVVILIASLGKGGWPGWHIIGECVIISTIVTLITGCLLTIRWSWMSVTRDIHIDDDERQYRRQETSLDRQAADLAQQPPEPTITLSATADRLHYVAYQVLLRHQDGLPTSRDKCVEAGICDQRQWNLINKAFKLIGWKPGNVLEAPGDHTAAWTEWKQKSYSDKNGLWVFTPTGSERKIK